MTPDQLGPNGRWEAILDEFPGIVVGVGPDGSVLFHNRLFGELPDEKTNIPQVKRARYLSKQSLLRACEEVLRSGLKESFEMENAIDLKEPPSGGWYQCEVRLSSLAGEHGRVAIASCLDISDRKRAEERLKKSEALLIEAQDLAHLGTWVWDCDQNEVTWSGELYRIYGLSASDFVPTREKYLEMVYFEDRDRVRAIMDEAFSKRNPFSHDERIVRSDGSVRWLHTWGQPVLDDGERLLRFIGFCQDITESKKHKETLENLLSQLQASLESTADGILVVDSDEKITNFNKRFVELWKMPQEVVYSRDDNKALAFVLDQLKEPAVFLKKVNELYSMPDAESHDVIEFKDGRIFERYSRPQRINEKIVGRVWSFRDVTERKKAEEQVREYTSRLKLLADASQTFAEARLNLPAITQAAARWVAEFFQDGCILRLFSQDATTAETAAFYHVDELILNALETVIPRVNFSLDEMGATEVLRSGKPVVVWGAHDELMKRLNPEHRGRLAHFQIFGWIMAPLWVSGRIIGLLTVLRYKKSVPFSEADKAFVQELAYRAALAVDNAQLYGEAQRAIRLREDFMSIASHELKTPLTPLKMQLQLLKGFVRTGGVAVGSKAEALLELIETSDQQIFRLVRLVEDLLEVSRISSGRLTLNLELVALTELVKEVTERFKAELISAQCEVRFEARASVRGLWDKLRIEQVLINLLTNAMKYGGGKPIEIAVSMVDRGETAVLTVKDLGIGIAKEDQLRIFDRFERAASVKRFGGLGLGLYIARQIVEAHGGQIGLESDLGKGATFTVELPVAGNST